MCKTHYPGDGSCQGGDCPGWHMSWVALVLGGTCPGWHLSWEALVREALVLGGSFPGGSCPGWRLSEVGVVLGVTCPGGCCPYTRAVPLDGSSIIWLALGTVPQDTQRRRSDDDVKT